MRDTMTNYQKYIHSFHIENKIGYKVIVNVYQRKNGTFGEPRCVMAVSTRKRRMQ